MVTLREIIYDIRELVNAYSDDSKLLDDHIAFMINNTRNALLKQQMSNLRRVVPKEALQVVCLPLEIDKNCFDDITVLRSSVAIPSTLDNTGRSDLYKVHAPGSRFTKNINTIDYSRLPFVSAQPYNELQLFVSVDQHSDLVIYNSKDKHLMLEEIQVENVFTDPKQAYEMGCGNDTGADFMDMPYPINAALISPLKNQVLQELIMKYKMPIDPHNDAEDGQMTSQAQAQTQTRK
jgi:hypothetical protein